MQRLFMGNEAMARGLVEGGVSLAASYPGTPASEILAAVAALAREEGVVLHAEWSVNEKVAYETALANAMTGRRSAVAMKQVGLNVASDPFMRSAYLGVIGGLVLIAADDPGPHSSQTEQDSRFFAMFAKVPVLDPASPQEAKDLVARAFALSEKYEIPVMLRPTTRVCHARQNVTVGPVVPLERPARFHKNPGRWCATPQFLRGLHRQLNDKIDQIALEPDYAPLFTPGDGFRPRTAIVASGVAAAHAWDLLDDLGLMGKVDFYQVIMPFPLNREFIDTSRLKYDQVLVLEETYPVVELQLAGVSVQGRQTRAVPREGELTPEVLRPVLDKFLQVPAVFPAVAPPAGGTRPTLCAGCGHRAAFYAIREAFPGGIFPSDIGCYTLGLNLGAVDSCHCMGAGISQAAGFYRAFTTAGQEFPTVVATIGDSTFFHAGIPALLNAVGQRARFILVILDNRTTAMTGHQPTPELGVTAMGGEGQPVYLADLVRACGVRFLQDCEPYDIPAMITLLKEADRFCRSPEGSVAVLVARHPCLLDREAEKSQPAYDMVVTEDCIACRHCLDNFECPALVFDEAGGRVEIDAIRCVGCGVCAHVCPEGAIVTKKK
jgi:indolepyruvate ferredoxin oxidoreductase alpha subunit